MSRMNGHDIVPTSTDLSGAAQRDLRVMCRHAPDISNKAPKPLVVGYHQLRGI